MAISDEFFHEILWFSIVMLVYKRVVPSSIGDVDLQFTLGNVKKSSQANPGSWLPSPSDSSDYPALLCRFHTDGSNFRPEWKDTIPQRNQIKYGHFGHFMTCLKHFSSQHVMVKPWYLGVLVSGKITRFHWPERRSFFGIVSLYTHYIISIFGGGTMPSIQQYPEPF